MPGKDVLYVLTHYKFCIYFLMENEGFVFLSKFQLPEVNPRTLYRSHLINLLSLNKHKKCIFLCAGAGYGKTTLVSQFINEAKVPFVYYQLRKEDNDPASFLSHLIAALRAVFPEFGEKIHKLSRFFNLPPGMVNIVLGTFINDFIQSINDDTFVILDDYHLLGESSPIDQIIGYLLDNIPKKMHLIICSRTELPIPLIKMRTKDEMIEIGMNAFRFAKEEIQELFTTTFSGKLSPDEIDWLYKHSEGWPACLRLILQFCEFAHNAPQGSFFNKLRQRFPKITEGIFDYFKREVFEYETAENQQFLIECSLLDYLSPEICNIVTARKDGKEILEELVKRNAFIVSLPNGNYRFHSLFQDFLRNRLQDEDKKREIYCRAAEYYKGYNIEEALKYYILANDFDSVIQIIDPVARQFIEQGRYASLVSIIEKLPLDAKENNPVVLKFYGEALSYLGNSVQAKDVLTRALMCCKKNPELRAELMYSLSGVLINEGNLKKSINFLEELLKVDSKRKNLLRASALNSLGAIYNSLGGKRLRQAKVYFKEAFRIAEKYGFDELKASILNNWAMNEFKMGNLIGAYSRILPAVELLKNHFSLGCGAGFYNGTKISLLLGHIGDALKILEIGIETCKPYNDLWSTANLWRACGLLCVEKNDLKTARVYVNKALEVYERIRVPYLITTALNELCNIEIMEDNLVEAEKIMSRIQGFKKVMKDAETISILLTKARLKASMKEHQRAEQILLRAARISKKYYLGLESYLVDLRLCTVIHKQGRDSEAIRILSRLIERTKPCGYDFLLIKELKRESGLVHLIVKNRIETDYIFSLLKKFRIFHIIYVSFFGTPSLIINGETICEEKWQTSKAKKLFYYLLLHKGKVFNQDELIEIFWPESGLKQGYNSLRKAVHHIRQTLNEYGVEEPILVHTGSYQISSDLYVTSDVEELDGLLKMYKEQGGLDNFQYQRLLNIYKDGFARVWYDNWVVEQADRYQQLIENIKRSIGGKTNRISQKIHKF